MTDQEKMRKEFEAWYETILLDEIMPESAAWQGWQSSRAQADAGHKEAIAKKDAELLKSQHYHREKNIRMTELEEKLSEANALVAKLRQANEQLQTDFALSQQAVTFWVKENTKLQAEVTRLSGKTCPECERLERKFVEQQSEFKRALTYCSLFASRMDNATLFTNKDDSEFIAELRAFIKGEYPAKELTKLLEEAKRQVVPEIDGLHIKMNYRIGNHVVGIGHIVSHHHLMQAVDADGLVGRACIEQYKKLSAPPKPEGVDK